MSSIRVRYSLQHVQYLYDSGEDRLKLENLIRAYRGIQALPPDDPNSFFLICSFHGLPFRGPGETDPTWWGGYCWHATVLFPTWHRAYLLRMEDALRSIPGCQDVTIPFWDELANPEPTSEPTIPSVLTSPTFELDGRTDNPLYSYKLQAALVNSAGGHRSSKPEGYDTVRYPLSGLMGTEEARKQTEVHNAAFTNHAQNAQILNDNVTQWLLGTVNIPDDQKGSRRPDTYSVRSRFLRSLFAPNYTVFSNTASQNHWIKDHGDGSSSHYVVSLESPHNAIHLALGGFYQAGVYNASPIRGANGDMGDNDTASFDPIFHFHHCFIDYVFAVWQRFWGFTTRGSLTVIPDYNGTILKEGQPPNFPPGTHIDMSTPLYPFQMPSGEYYNSDDVTDMNDLGVSYGPGSLDPIIVSVDPASLKSPLDILNSTFDDMTLADSDLHVDSPLPLTKYGLDPITLAGSDPNTDSPFPVIKWVHNINRTQFHGSFVIRLYAEGHDGKEVEVGREAVLSRWDVKGCRNCQSHLDVDLYVPIDATTLKFLQGPRNAAIKWRVGIQTHELSHHIADPGEEEEEAGFEPEVDDF